MSVQTIDANRWPALKDVQLVNVYSAEIVATNIGIKNGRVVTISPTLPKQHPLAVIDGEHNYAISGMIDTHIHIETTLLTPLHRPSLR